MSASRHPRNMVWAIFRQILWLTLSEADSIHAITERDREKAKSTYVSMAKHTQNLTSAWQNTRRISPSRPHEGLPPGEDIASIPDPYSVYAPSWSQKPVIYPLSICDLEKWFAETSLLLPILSICGLEPILLSDEPAQQQVQEYRASFHQPCLASPSEPWVCPNISSGDHDSSDTTCDWPTRIMLHTHQHKCSLWNLKVLRITCVSKHAWFLFLSQAQFPGRLHTVMHLDARWLLSHRATCSLPPSQHTHKGGRMSCSLPTTPCPCWCRLQCGVVSTCHGRNKHCWLHRCHNH
jgi:hypothetical protein